MDIGDFKRWHWMVIGLLAGLLFGAVRLWSGPTFVSENADSIMQGEFEANVSGALHPSQRQLLSVDRSDVQRSATARNVIVHAPLDSDPLGHFWVTGSIQMFFNRPADGAGNKGPFVRVEQWRPFRYDTQSPYTAYTGAPGKYPSVVGYLSALSQKDDLDFSFHYAFWEKPVWTMTIPTSIGFLAIGIFWPTVLNFLNRAGYGRKPEEKLMKLSSGKRKRKKAKAGVTAGMVDFEWSMDTTADEAVPVAVVEAAAPEAIKVLPGSSPDTTEIPVDEVTEADLEYRGEYYPVAKAKAAVDDITELSIPTRNKQPEQLDTLKRPEKDSM